MASSATSGGIEMVEEGKSSASSSSRPAHGDACGANMSIYKQPKKGRRRGCGLSHRAQSLVKVVLSGLSSGAIILGLVSFATNLKASKVTVNHRAYSFAVPLYDGFGCAGDQFGSYSPRCAAVAQTFIAAANASYCERTLRDTFSGSENFAFRTDNSFFWITCLWGGVALMVVLFSVVHDFDMLIRRKAHFWPVDAQRSFWCRRLHEALRRWLMGVNCALRPLAALPLAFAYLALGVALPFEFVGRVVVSPKYYSSLAVIVGYFMLFVVSVFVVIWVGVFGFEVAAVLIDSCACSCRLSIERLTNLQYLLIGTIASVRSALSLWQFQDDIGSGFFYTISHSVPFMRAVQLNPAGPALSLYKHFLEQAHREVAMQHRPSVATSDPRYIEHLLEPSIYHASERGQRSIKQLNNTLLCLSFLLCAALAFGVVWVAIAP